MYSIAVDGPAGAGKSTIARKVAEKIGFIYVDTGAMYRAMALYFIRKGIAGDDEESISGMCKDIEVTLGYEEGEQQVLLNGENVNAFIRTEEVSAMTSLVAKQQTVREKLVQLQREMAKKENVIMDGRDIGTCVLPQATVKIYLTASVEERARRRYEEQCARGITCNLEDISKDIVLRDTQDMNREFAPLKQAEDAVLVDSSAMSIDEVVQTIIDLIPGGIIKDAG